MSPLGLRSTVNKWIIVGLRRYPSKLTIITYIGCFYKLDFVQCMWPSHYIYPLIYLRSLPQWWSETFYISYSSIINVCRRNVMSNHAYNLEQFLALQGIEKSSLLAFDSLTISMIFQLCSPLDLCLHLMWQRIKKIHACYPVKYTYMNERMPNNLLNHKKKQIQQLIFRA